MPGLNDGVQSVISWDADGEGPGKPMLVVGGRFSKVAGGDYNNYLLRNIAISDGTNFYPLGDGFSNEVTGLWVYHNKLFVSDSYRVYLWNGQSWEIFGIGLSGGEIYSLCVFDDKLIASGSFTKAGDINVPGTAIWDGNNWSAIEGCPRHIFAMGVYNDELIVHADFDAEDHNNIAAWNGESWRRIGATTYGSIGKMIEYNGKLIVSGYFSSISGVPANNMAQWDGSSWSEVAGGGRFSCLAVFDNKLIAGSHESYFNSIRQWDGNTWQTIGNSLGGYVDALCVYEGELVVGGSFIETNYNEATQYRMEVNRIVKWDGNRWKGFGNGLSGAVNVYTIYNGNIVAAGGFTRAGGKIVNGIAMWNGSEWQKLGTGVSGGNVFALTVYNGDLIAGGTFTSAGGVAVNRIAKWNGNAWQSFGTSGGLPGQVNSLVVYNGQLVAGGAFGSGQSVSYWEGHSWQPLGGVLKLYDNPVTALTIYNGKLAAASQGRASVFNGSLWSGTGGIFQDGSSPSYIYVLAEYKGRLIAAGTFTKNNSTDLKYIAEWDGNRWQQLGEGIDSNYDFQNVNALAVYDDKLFAGGRYSSGSGYLKSWNGQWKTIFAGNYDISEIKSLSIYNSELIIGGSSYLSGHVPSSGWMRWGPVNEFAGDLNHDCNVDEYDLLQITEQWLDENCGSSGNCNQADLNYDDTVNFADFTKFAPDWLKGVE
jgi:hypothetical protein